MISRNSVSVYVIQSSKANLWISQQADKPRAPSCNIGIWVFAMPDEGHCKIKWFLTTHDFSIIIVLVARIRSQCMINIGCFSFEILTFTVLSLESCCNKVRIHLIRVCAKWTGYKSDLAYHKYSNNDLMLYQWVFLESGYSLLLICRSLYRLVILRNPGFLPTDFPQNVNNIFNGTSHWFNSAISQTAGNMNSRPTYMHAATMDLTTDRPTMDLATDLRLWIY
jgi:hypothetical protein